jgi:hypothetical protein
LLLQAVLGAADELKLNRTSLARELGKDRSTLNRANGIEPASKTGELAEQVQCTEGLVEIVPYLDAWARQSER